MPCASARRRPPSRRRSCAATPTSSAATSSRRSREAERGRERHRARAPLPPAQDVRVRARLGGARRAPGRAREPSARRAGQLSSGDELPLRTAQAQLAVLDSYRDTRGARRAPGGAQRRIQPRPARADRGRRGARGRALAASPIRSSATSEEKGISLRELSAALEATSAALDARYAELRARWFERLLGAERDRASRRASTPPTCGASRRSRRPTPRSARPRSAWRR